MGRSSGWWRDPDAKRAPGHATTTQRMRRSLPIRPGRVATPVRQTAVVFSRRPDTGLCMVVARGSVAVTAQSGQLRRIALRVCRVRRWRCKLPQTSKSRSWKLRLVDSTKSCEDPRVDADSGQNLARLRLQGQGVLLNMENHHDSRRVRGLPAAVDAARSLRRRVASFEAPGERGPRFSGRLARASTYAYNSREFYRLRVRCQSRRRGLGQTAFLGLS